MIGLYVGLVLLGGLFGVSAALFWLWGYNVRTRVDSGQRPFGSSKPLDPVLNTDPEVIDAIRQERYEKGQEPYYNEA